MERLPVLLQPHDGVPLPITGDGGLLHIRGKQDLLRPPDGSLHLLRLLPVAVCGRGAAPAPGHRDQ